MSLIALDPKNKEFVSEEPAMNHLVDWYTSMQPEEMDKLTSMPCSIRMPVEDLAYIDVMSSAKGITRSEFIRMLALSSLSDLVHCLDVEMRDHLTTQAKIKYEELCRRVGISHTVMPA